jgi:predicted nucleic acid-binding Zn ribbon protein
VSARDGGLRGPRGPQRIGEILSGVLEQRGLGIQIQRQKALEEWAGRVGERIAAVTRARAVSEGTLFVEVRSSAWLMELNMMKREILQRVNEGCREAPLEKVVFVLAEEV